MLFGVRLRGMRPPAASERRADPPNRVRGAVSYRTAQGARVTADLSAVGMLTAFAAGIVSFLSPCVLPLVPGYVSYVAGRSPDRPGHDPATATVLLCSLFFVLGFSTIFIALGASATAIGEALLAYRYQANLVGGVVVILFGLLMVGLPRPSFLYRDVRLHPTLPGGRPAGACLLGAAFGFGWTPCIGPVLGALLTVSAVSATVPQGMVLLGVYALGLGAPFLFVALFADRLAGRLRALGRFGLAMQVGAGAIVIAMGVAMITGWLSALSYQLLEAFPVLARIG